MHPIALLAGPVAAMLSLGAPTLPAPAARTTAGAARAVRERTMLLFEIDEGFSGGLLGRFRDDPAGLDRCLTRVRDGLAPLCGKYDVCVLVYPCQAYIAPGRAGQSRVRPALQRLLAFFARQAPGTPRIGVFLEAYSSGIATQQSGEIDSLQAPLLGSVADDHERRGLSMDMTTLASLADAYPGVFRGIRLHEVYGSDIGWRVRPEGRKHGFTCDEQVVRACVDLCRDKQLRLLWSDSCWLMKCPPTTGEPAYVYSDEHRPYYLSEPYRSLQDEAERALGSRLCFSWANNNYHTTQNLEYLDARIGPDTRDAARPLPDWLYWRMPLTEFPMKKRPRARWGMSIQSWFWHELANTLNGRYVGLGEMECPEEVLGAYALKGLREGASVLQFEPSWFLFNEPAPFPTVRPTLCRDKPEYSARPALLRLTGALLQPGSRGGPPDRLEPLYDRNQRRLHENDAARPPRLYAETALLLPIGPPTPRASVQSVTCFEFASTGVRWRLRNEERLPYAALAGLDRACPIELTDDGVDEVAILTAGGRIGVISDWGAGMVPPDFLAADAGNGSVLGMAAANLAQDVIGHADRDELVLARSVPGSRAASLWSYACDAHGRFHAAKLIVPRDAAGPGRFLGLVGLRGSADRWPDGRRSIDRLVALSETGAGRVSVVQIGTGVRGTLPDLSARASGLAFAALDVDVDGRDELLAVWRSRQKWMARVYRLGAGAPLPTGPARVVAPARLGLVARPFAVRRRVLYNARAG